MGVLPYVSQWRMVGESQYSLLVSSVWSGKVGCAGGGADIVGNWCLRLHTHLALPILCMHRSGKQWVCLVVWRPFWVVISLMPPHTSLPLIIIIIISHLLLSSPLRGGFLQWEAFGNKHFCANEKQKLIPLLLYGVWWTHGCGCSGVSSWSVRCLIILSIGLHANSVEWMPFSFCVYVSLPL